MHKFTELLAGVVIPDQALKNLPALLTVTASHSKVLLPVLQVQSQALAACLSCLLNNSVV